MRTEKIIDLIRGYAQYDKKTLSYLSKVMRKYPYFQLAHLLYTLNLYHLEDAHFPDELRKTATYLNDRKKLFFLVENRFFDSDKIETLQHEIPKNANSVFNLIDSFLSQKEETPEKMQDSSTVPADYVSHYLLENPEEKSENSKPLQFQDTIDRFLKEDEISPIKIELIDEDVESKGREEIKKTSAPDLEQSDDGDFYSETLAKIYIKQRKYDKALEIIHKIVLLYPEKSSYFADRIQMLEDLVSINKNKTE
jgi:tetratricopeptide (TPR) repeat protein